MMTEQSFNQLLLQNKDFLKPFSLSLTHNREESEDLVQDTLYRALVNKDKFRAGTNISAWLYIIMRNIFINNYWRKKKFVRVSSEVPQDYYLFQTDRVARNNGMMNMGLREIKTVMQRLPDIFRRAFEMYYFGYSYQEIADKLQEPLGTIKSRIHVARKILTANIQRY